MTRFALLVAAAVAVAAVACPIQDGDTIVVADVHDGDQKKVALSGSTLTITSADVGQNWIVVSNLDAVACNATVDFNVTGKPSPPPVPLTATFWWLSTTALSDRVAVGFTDPSLTLTSEPDYPVNYWIETAKEMPPLREAAVASTA